VRFHVRSGDRTVTAAAKRMEDVELTQFLNDKDFAISCGSRTVPDAVYMTWRVDATPIAEGSLPRRFAGFCRGYVPDAPAQIRDIHSSVKETYISLPSR
jgi:hypothetical protein